MEDILAIIAVLAGVALTTLAVRWFMRRSKEKREEAYRETQRKLEATRVWRESMRTKSISAAVKNTSYVPPRTKETTKKSTPSYATTSSPVATTSSDDGFLNGMLTGMLINSTLDVIASGSGVGKSTFGLDDNESRKSISDSMDTSSSWSSSDSYSSSSDSGPSSDW